MVKRVYNIIGFDCANCAARTEAHLNKCEGISYARIDFAANKLYLTYVDKELDIDTILLYIADVENDEITITPNSIDGNKKKLFTKDMLILIIRIAVGLLFSLLALFVNFGNSWINFAFYMVSIAVVIYDVFYKAVYKIFHLQNPFDEYLLICLAVAGVIVIGLVYRQDDYFDAFMVIGLFQVGQIFESIATNKSKSAIAGAMDLRADYANLIDGDTLKTVPPDTLKVGDLIKIKVGETIPVDGTIIEGEGSIDTSSLTGEFVPVGTKLGDSVYSGCSLKSGSITVKVNKEFKDSTITKILEMVTTSGERKSKADKFITKFARIYTPIIMLISALFIVIGGLITSDWATYIYRGLEFIVIGCPCAIVISVPLAYFSGIGLASKNGIVIKGANYLDELQKLKTIVTDKTGTLTHGAFVITKVSHEGVSEKEFYDALYACESLSNHPISKAILGEKNVHKIGLLQENYVEIAGLGISTTYKGDHLFAGNYKLMVKEEINFIEPKEYGTVIYVAKNKKYLGYVVLNDTLKDNAQPMVNLVHSLGAKIVLLTGDKEENASETCKRLGIDEWKSELMPEDKEKYLEEEMKKTKGTVGFIGDGINDAPSIARADIGFAMGGIGSDMAVSNADVIIMNDDPARVYDAMYISKLTRRYALFNTIFSLAVKIGVMIISATVPHMPMWVAVLADTGLTVLMVLNSLSLLYRKVKRKY